MKDKFIEFAKKTIIGRDFPLFDKAIFYLSNGNNSGWVVGNKLRNFFYGKKRYISNEPVILVGGYPRSGTTLLQSLLEQHSEIVSPEIEVNVLQDICDTSRLKKETKGLKRKGFLFSNKEIQDLNLGEDLIKDGEKIIQFYKKKHSASRVLLKQPKHIFFLKEIFKYYPNCKFINMIRDGRDATMSQRFFCLPKNKEEHPYDWCCRQWVTSIKRGIKFRKDPRYIEVYYENLLKNPLKEINRILKFLELKPIKKIIYGKKKYSDHPNVDKPINLKIIGKGTKKMSEKDKQIFNKICGETQKNLGYKI